LIRIVTVAALLVLAGCGGSGRDAVARGEPPLYPNETPELRRLINYYADVYDVPASLIHRSIDRESDYRVDARAGPYYGLMQILPQTARTMGHRGPASELLDADTNLRYAVRYLRGAWLLSDGDEAEAIGWYARGYYYEARDRCMLVETGLNDREIARNCRG
jgi:soluble lytic murein transglycosylase-like protein|tara:strand:+ start:668 stop:1153 length:486 start_codon:yes stop_codon:yes gene_type:complete